MIYLTLTSHFDTVRIFIVESEPIIQHCDNIYEEMWRISINSIPINWNLSVF